MWYTQHPTQSAHARHLELRAQRGQLAYLADIAQHCSYAVTLQTVLSTHAVKPAQMDRHFEAVRQSLHQLRMRTNRALTGNGWRRNPAYLPIFVPVIEGTLNTYDRNRTLHIHLAVGNLPARLTETELYATYRGCWLASKCAADDVVLAALDTERRAGWLGYLTKEQRAGRTDTVDYYNTQIPDHIVAQLT